MRSGNGLPRMINLLVLIGGKTKNNQRREVIMTLTSELFWENLDMLNRTSIAYQCARYALRLNYKSLPENVVHAAKRSLLDSLGNTIGAYMAPGRPILEGVVDELGGPEESTLFGSGRRTSALNATLFNGWLLRFSEIMDTAIRGGHQELSIPTVLAVAEREKANGRDFLTSIVIAYELGSRNVGGSGVNLPAAVGKLMGLTEDQIANAIGITASHNGRLGILDADKEEYSMSKNLGSALTGYTSIMACMMAKRGFTGPVRVVEGHRGLRESRGEGGEGGEQAQSQEHSIDFSGWRITEDRFKTMPLNTTTQNHVECTLAIVIEHDLKPEDIESVRIKASRRETRHTGTTLAKKYPRNAETADHSAFFANAIAIKERSCDLEQFTTKNFTDPVILDLIERITVEADTSIPDMSRPVTSTITTKDGRVFQKSQLQPHGMGGYGQGDDPLTDKELEDKFKRLTNNYVSLKQIKGIFDTVWNVEKLDNIGKLTAQTVFKSR